MYQVIETKQTSPDGLQYTVFGVEGGGERIEDLTCAKEEALRFTRLCNAGAVHPHRLMDMAEVWVDCGELY